MIFGIVLIIAGLVIITTKSQVKLIGERLVDNATIRFDNQDVSILSFNASKNGNYSLRTKIIPLETKYGGITIKPLVYAILVDDEGLKAFFSNATTYIYLKVSDLEEAREFTIDNLSGNKRFHMIFSTPLPEQIALVSVTMVYTSTPEHIQPMDVSMLIGGIGIIVGSLIMFKIRKTRLYYEQK